MPLKEVVIVEDLQKLLGGIRIYKLEMPEPVTVTFATYRPAKTEDEALFNVRTGFHMNGVTRLWEKTEDGEARRALVAEWMDHPNLANVQPAFREYGIYVGEITRPAGGLSVGGHPVPPSSHLLPATLQEHINGVLKIEGEPGGKP